MLSSNRFVCVVEASQSIGWLITPMFAPLPCWLTLSILATPYNFKLWINSSRSVPCALLIVIIELTNFSNVLAKSLLTKSKLSIRDLIGIISDCSIILFLKHIKGVLPQVCGFLLFKKSGANPLNLPSIKSNSVKVLFSKTNALPCTI